jgi:hypothetical protein
MAGAGASSVLALLALVPYPCHVGPHQILFELVHRLVEPICEFCGGRNIAPNLVKQILLGSCDIEVNLEISNFESSHLVVL